MHTLQQKSNTYSLLFEQCCTSIYIESTKQDEEANKLLYVIASRAKSRLYLFSEKGRKYWDRGLREYVAAFPTRQLFQNKCVEYDENF